MQTKSESAQGGYTLIEVLVAFTLLAMTLTVILSSLAAGVRNIETASEYTQAVFLAEAQLAAVSSRSVPPPDGQRAGRADDYTISLTVTPIGSVNPNEAYSARRVEVEIAWPGRSDRRRIELSTIRLDPVDDESAGQLAWR